MSFLRSLSAGVSGLRNHQIMMDVIGNNIANINTIAFKSGRATFSELFAQTLRGAGRPVGANGGTNPVQVGLGISLNTMDTIFTQGSLETTSKVTDLAIQGSGFFIVKKNGATMYTRAGTFDIDAGGRLVNPTSGAVVQGKMADMTGVLPSGTRLEDIVIDRDIKAPAQATTTVTLAGNLDSSAAVYSPGPPPTGGTSSSAVPVFDSLGNQIPLTITYTKTADNTWAWTATISAGAGTTTVGSGTIAFNGTDGTLQAVTGNPISFDPGTGGAPLSIDLDFGTPGVFAGVTQTSGASVVSVREQDGYASGSLVDIEIGSGGQVLGVFDNGVMQTLAQILLAEFSNPAGLVRDGENMYSLSANSGSAAVVEAGGASGIVAGALEQSNVDLADEFTKMIMAQRGFQANARVITTSDEFLQEVVNLKR